MNAYLADTFNLILTGILIILNAFFVAAEFALVKVNKSKIKLMQQDNNPFAGVTLWLYKRQSMALSTCQMGITMASLALGWIGEPALAHLIKPVLESVGITSLAALHGLAFTIAFTLITALHIVIGEQFPKIYAIRKPIITIGWSAFPLKIFYVIFYPFMWMLDRTTAKMLKLVGIDSRGEHEAILTEEEIMSSLSMAYHQGDIDQHSHDLLDAAFRFDDQVTRQIMLPRGEVIFFDIRKTPAENIGLAKKTKHTRFPLCDGSLDNILGVVHIKDLMGEKLNNISDFRKIARNGVFVPDTLPIDVLLQEFRKTRQHLAFVEDEYGTVIGMVTLENVIEQLVGNVQDEFDAEKPGIVKEGEDKYLVDGNVTIELINKQINVSLESPTADTISGLLMEKEGIQLIKGQKIKLREELTAEILALKNRRITKIRLWFEKKASESH